VTKRLALASVLGAAALAAGCGGGDDTSATEDWANDVCSAFSTWTGSISSAAQSLQGGNLSQSGFETAAEDVTDATQTLVDDLQGLGRPDTEAGEQAEESLDRLADDVQSGLDTIEEAVDDVDGASGILTAVSTISSALVTMGNQVASAVQSLGDLDSSGELEDAFRQANACDDLRSGQG
jgi:uncharacterized protein YoxC